MGDASFFPQAGDGTKGPPTPDKKAKKVCVTGGEGGWYAEVEVRAMRGTEKNIGKNIRALREPEPYHGYGIRYKDEVIERKEGKTAGK